MSGSIENQSRNVGEKQPKEEFELLSSKSSQTELPANGKTLKRETWNSKVEFLLSIIGFAVELSNVWRFPYICFKNGGGAFLIAYCTVAVLAGIPMFYLELLLGQYHRTGCISIWKKICPLMKGIGYASCLIGTIATLFYNTIIAWAVYYFFRSFTSELPWSSCNHTWADSKCFDPIYSVDNNQSFSNTSQLPAQLFFEREVLQIHKSTGLTDLGSINWPIAGCLLLVEILIYFCAWKGIRSSGKAVWFTATFPYVVLLILLIRGVTLPGAGLGIKYYLKPQWSKLKDPILWLEAAVQISFSLGPGFGVLITLSSYNDFKNNCRKDAIITSFVNCFTSFLSGFVVFSVLGYMAHILSKTDIEEVTTPGIGLLFVVYGQALSTLSGSVFFSTMFFLMLITLGLDSMFAGLEAFVTGFADEYPETIGKHRKLFLLFFLIFVFLGSLPTTTYGGTYVVTLLEMYASGVSLLIVVLMECITVVWIYGTDRLAADMKRMLGFSPSLFLRVTWKFCVPGFMMFIIIMSIALTTNLVYGDYVFPDWSTVLGWMISLSSILLIPGYAAYRYLTEKGTLRERLQVLIKPEICDQNQKGRNSVMISTA